MAYRKISKGEDRPAPEAMKLPVGESLRKKIRQVAARAEAAIMAVVGTELPTTAEALEKLERLLSAVARGELIGAVLEAVLEAVNEDGEFVWACVDKARELRGVRPDGKYDVRVKLLCGEEVKIKTRYSKEVEPDRPELRRGQRGEGGRGCFPVLAQLGITEGASLALQSDVAWTAAALGSFEEAQEALALRGIELRVNAIRRIVHRVGDLGLLDRESGAAEEPSPLAGKRVVVAIDGGRLRLRVTKRGRRRKSGWHGYDTPWREPKQIPGVSAVEAAQHARAWRKLLKRGRAEAVADEIDVAAQAARGKAALELRNHAEYLRRNADKMRYRDLKRAGLPRGTGVVESAIRRVINLRLKSPGTFWDEENAERMLLLRCRLKAGRWADLQALLRQHSFGPYGTALRDIVQGIPTVNELS